MLSYLLVVLLCSLSAPLESAGITSYTASPLITSPSVVTAESAALTVKNTRGKPHYEMILVGTHSKGSSSLVFLMAGFHEGTLALWQSLWGNVSYPVLPFYVQSTFPHRMIFSEMGVDLTGLIGVVVLPQRWSIRDEITFFQETGYLTAVTVMTEPATTELVNTKFCDDAVTMNYAGQFIAETPGVPPPAYTPMLLHVKGHVTWKACQKAYVMTDPAGNDYMMESSWQYYGAELDSQFTAMLGGTVIPAGWTGRIIPSLKHDVVAKFNETNGALTLVFDVLRDNFYWIPYQIPNDPCDPKNPSHPPPAGIASREAPQAGSYLMNIPPELASMVSARMAEEKEEQEEEE